MDGDIHNAFIRNGEGDIRLSEERIREMLKERDCAAARRQQAEGMAVHGQ